MDLADWRSRINDLDNQILNLLNQRAEAALQIGNLKRRQGTPSYVPEREAEILRQLSAQNGGAPPAHKPGAGLRGGLVALPPPPGAPALAGFGPPAAVNPPAATR